MVTDGNQTYCGDQFPIYTNNHYVVQVKLTKYFMSTVQFFKNDKKEVTTLLLEIYCLSIYSCSGLRGSYIEI